MFNWTNIDEIYTYDGSFEGFLSVIFHIFEVKQIPQKIVPISDFIPDIIHSSHTNIETDLAKSSRVFDGIMNISHMCMYYTRNVFISNEPSKEILLVNYIIASFQYGANVNTMLSLDFVLNVQKISKRVSFEIIRLKGFVRFSDIGNNLYYSKIEPDNNILEFLCKHFKERLPNQNFIIYDANHSLIGAYSSVHKKIEILDSTNIPNFTIPKISDTEKKYQDMWKMFFKNIAIKERTNPRLQKQYMPKRYWKNMLET